MDALSDLVGESPAFQAVRARVTRLLTSIQGARRLPIVLLEGETGSGKGLLAQTLHNASVRASGPFLAVNCAAIPDTLAESELFGFESGAHSEARRPKPGLFQSANHGTLFLDEVGLLSEGLQAKLLKAIEDQKVRRLGGTRDESIDVWVISATNADLQAEVRERRFREDLYQRLALVRIELPPLRDRGGDVVLLANRFLARACQDFGIAPKRFAPDAQRRLVSHAWPGNLRELSNVIERAVLLGEGPVITGPMLELEPPRSPDSSRASVATPSPGSLDTTSRDDLLTALEGTGWNISRTATILGITRNTVRARMEKLGLRRGQEPAKAAARPGSLSDSPAALAESSSITSPHIDLVEPRPRAITIQERESRQSPASAPAPAGRPVRRERRHVTVMRVILTSSGTGDPSGWRGALDVVVEKIEAFGGRVESLADVEVEAAFGLEPTDDAPRRAANAALAIRRAVDRAGRPTSEVFSGTIILHTGPCMVWQVGRQSMLDHHTRREIAGLLDQLLPAEDRNSIVVSAATVPFLDRRFALVPTNPGIRAERQPHRLLGPLRLETGVGPIARGLVGRRFELDLLRDRFEAASQGRGQIIGITGEPGIGKSRLVAEVRESVGSDSLTWLEGACQPHGRSIPYLPVIDIVRAACGITEEDNPSSATGKIQDVLHELGLEDDLGPTLLLNLLCLPDGLEGAPLPSPESLKARLLGLLRQLIVRLSQVQPVVLVVEDLHWVDGASEEYLTSLTNTVSGASVLLLTTYRPAYEPPWIAGGRFTQVALSPLSSQESLEVIRPVLRTCPDPDRIAAMIVARAEGNPLFLEELARMAVTTEGSDPGIPGTLEDVLLARMAFLSEEARSLIQAASILGRSASLPLIRRICDSETALDGVLAELCGAGFLYESASAGEPAYVFRHALIQELARATLEPARERVLHTRAAQALEVLYAERLEEVYDRLALHYTQTEDDEKAIAYLTRAGQRFARAYAHAEAIEAFRYARRRIDSTKSMQGGPSVLALVIDEAHSLHVLGRFLEARDLLAQHESAGEQTEDQAHMARYFFWVARTWSVLGDRARTKTCLERAMASAREAHDDTILGQVHFLLAYECYWAGQTRQGLTHANAAVELLQAGPERWWLGMAHWVAALNAIVLAQFESGRRAAQAIRGIGETTGDLRLQNYGAWTEAWIDTLSGDAQRAIAGCEWSITHSQDPVNTAYASGQLGHAWLEEGEPARARPLLQGSIERLQALAPAFRQTRSRFMSILADCELALGELDQAQRLADEALAIGRDVDFPYAVGLATRVLGRIALARGDADAATAWLAEALHEFLAIGASFEAHRTEQHMQSLAPGDRHESE